jgi:LPXTG-site transpeptidase (sortase) family protein
MTDRTALRTAIPSRTRLLVLGSVAALVCVAAFLVGGALLGGDPAGRAETRPETAQAEPARALPTERASTLQAVPADEEPPPLPTASDSPQLHLPDLGVTAPVVPVGLKPGGVLDPPSAVSDVGWWDGSAEAGEDDGQTVLTGHAVHTGGGVMDRLEDLEPGDRVRVTDNDGHVDYAVTEVVTWTKAELSDNAVEAFGQDRHHGRLVMVSCEGWDGSSWTANVVGFAEPVTPP